jgi:hypothetical protein
MPKFKAVDSCEVDVTRVQTGNLTLVKNVPARRATLIIAGIEAVHDGKLEIKAADSANEPTGLCVVEMISGIRVEVLQSYAQLRLLIGTSS